MSEETGAETPPKSKKPKTIAIYNKSRHGQKITLHKGALPPGQSARVPLKLGQKLIETIPYCVRAERGDPMDQ